MVSEYRNMTSFPTRQTRRQQRSDRAGAPTVDFYGDGTAWSTSALLHSEPLIERSSRHEWKIRPHRHDRLAQLFGLLRGSGTGRFDAVDYTLTAPCIAVLPASCVHEFEWALDSDGYALSLASALVGDIERAIAPHDRAFREPAVIDIGRDADFITALFDAIHAECTSERLLKESALDSLIRTLAIWVARRTTTAPPAGPAERGQLHHLRFVRLVEQHHREQWRIADYARELGITAAHLNAICRSRAGKSALGVVHDRVLLAARRELAYTDKSIAGVAAGLGFAEPSYFTRFFRQRMGMTPKAYRRRSGTQSG